MRFLADAGISPKTVDFLAELVAATRRWHNAVVESSENRLPEWERLLAAERHLQYLVPGAVLVGGTAAALHAGHRVSMDGDHIVEDLRGRFDEVLEALELAAGWQTERIQRPVLILGQLDGIFGPTSRAAAATGHRSSLGPCWKTLYEETCTRKLTSSLEPIVTRSEQR